MVEGGRWRGVQTRAAKGGYEIGLASHENEFWALKRGKFLRRGGEGRSTKVKGSAA
jgi:hypothetical protein